MERIIDNNLLCKYVKMHKIDEIFSYWDKYEPTMVKFNKGEIISSEENPLQELLFIVDGTFKIFYISLEGKTLGLSSREELIMFGELEFVGESGSPYLQAVSDVTCIAISFEKHRDILNEDISFCRYMIKCLARKLKIAADISSFNQLHSMENRLAAYILSKESNGIIAGRWTETASLLSSSYRQLMRVLSKFCTNGLIKKIDKKGMYLILNRDELESLSKGINW